VVHYRTHVPPTLVNHAFSITKGVCAGYIERAAFVTLYSEAVTQSAQDDRKAQRGLSAIPFRWCTCLCRALLRCAIDTH
jgi:hypothetical protein